MNAVQKAIFEVKARIPREILQEAFVGRLFTPVLGAEVTRRLPVSLDHLIRERVVEDRVIPDTNLVGGIEVTFPLNALIPQTIEPWITIYTVPKKYTQGRVISRVLSITTSQMALTGSTSLGMSGSSPLLDAAAGVLASASPLPRVSTAYIQMIGENTFMIDDIMALPNNAWLRCVVEADSDFGHLNPTVWHSFAKLVEYATKAYIYNTLAIEVGMAYLSGGQELGKFKEIMDTYSDANENYETFLQEEWKVTQGLSDPLYKQRHLRSIVGGNW